MDVGIEILLLSETKRCQNKLDFHSLNKWRVRENNLKIQRIQRIFFTFLSSFCFFISHAIFFKRFSNFLFNHKTYIHHEIFIFRYDFYFSQKVDGKGINFHSSLFRLMKDHLYSSIIGSGHGHRQDWREIKEKRIRFLFSFHFIICIQMCVLPQANWFVWKLKETVRMRSSMRKIYSKIKWFLKQTESCRFSLQCCLFFHLILLNMKWMEREWNKERERLRLLKTSDILTKKINLPNYLFFGFILRII